MHLTGVPLRSTPAGEKFVKPLKMDCSRLVKKSFPFEKKIGWSEIIAIGAVIISSFAFLLSYWAWQDSRAISGLDLKPEIKIDARLNKAKYKIFHLVVFNSGPVDAFQLEVHFIHHRYFKKLNKIMISGGGTETKFSIPQLAPFKRETFAVVDSGLNLPPIPVQTCH